MNKNRFLFVRNGRIVPLDEMASDNIVNKAHKLIVEDFARHVDRVEQELYRLLRAALKE